MGLKEDFAALLVSLQGLQTQVDDADAAIAAAHDAGRVEGVQAGLDQGRAEGFKDGFAQGVASVPATPNSGFTQEQVDSAVAAARADEQSKSADAVSAAQAADGVALDAAVSQARSEEQAHAALAVNDAKAAFKESVRAKLKARLAGEEAIAEQHIDEDLDSAP